MIQGIGVQTKNAINDSHPAEGFAMLARAGFTNADFSLNGYLSNKDLYQNKLNTFFDKSIEELQEYFHPHKAAAKAAGITISQMHMPYPIYIPAGKKEVNEYLWKEMVPKSMQICKFLECPYMVIHGFKMAKYLGSENAEWEYTEKLIDYLAPMAAEMGITVCIENLYDSVGGHLVEGHCCNVHKAVERIDRINARYGTEVLGFCFDTGHANLVGIDFEKFITTLGNRLKVLHIHDNDGVMDLHQIPYVFTRTRDNKPATDWDGFIKGLKNIGFDKVLSFETAPVLASFPEELKEDVLGFIARIGQQMAKRIAEGKN